MSKQKSKITVEEIEEMALRGEDTTMYFTEPKLKPAMTDLKRVSSEKQIQRVNVDFSTSLLSELDEVVSEINVSRQSVIKMMVRSALDRHYLAKKAR